MKLKLGDFEYDEFKFEKDLGSRTEKPVILLENGAKYLGEWLNHTEIRQGRGT
jgi:hypothetical protein